VTQPPQAPWWATYFTSHYATLYKGPLADELRTEHDVETLARLFAGTEKPVLDLCCGYGRHVALLAKAKIPVVGLDFSSALLAATRVPIRPRLVRGDMRSLPFRTGSLDGVAMMFNSFGYFTEEENLSVLREVARVLSPAGRLVMELPSRRGMEAIAEETPAAISHNGTVTIYESWSVEEESGRLRGKGHWELRGEQQQWDISLRLHTPVELSKLLREAGFQGPVEFRPNDEFHLLGTETAAPKPGDGIWKRVPGMAVLASLRPAPPM
jgi:SAM-dependent methyltransferase